MWSRQVLLEVAKASPVAVAEHDKAAWLDLFSASGLVNDPVGSRPHQGRNALDRFYETFIAPNDIHFDVEHDIVCGWTVVRDVVIHIRMPTGQRVVVPAHLRYELTEESGVLRIRGLFAHWELVPMVFGTLKSGVRGIISYSKLSKRMWACQGFDGMRGFMRGFSGVGKRGKRTARKLLDALGRDDTAAAGEYLDPSVRFEVPAGTMLSPQEAGKFLRGLTCTKLIAAGQDVTATATLNDTRGIMWLSFRRGRVERVVFFCEPSA